MPVNQAFSESDPRTTTLVSNLSRTGVFIHTDKVLPVGWTVAIRFVVFPDDPVLFEAKGCVVRHGTEPSGMGVEFVSLGGDQVRVIDEILRRHAQASPRGRRGIQRIAIPAHGFRSTRHRDGH